MNRTVNKCLDYYYKNHVIPYVVDKARREYCIKPLKRILGRKQAEKLVSADIRQYDDNRKKDGVGQGTVCLEVNTLMAALNYCQSEGYISCVPALRAPRRPEARQRWLTLQEIDKLLSVAGRRAGIYIQIAVATGGRPEAIDDLKWSQVDLENGLLDFNQKGREQTNKRRPKIPIPDNLLEMFHVEHARKRTEYVLGTNASTYKCVSGAIRRAGLKDVTRKTLRHTWATHAASKGVSMWEIAGVLGVSLKTAEGFYAHHAPEFLRKAVNA